MKINELFKHRSVTSCMSEAYNLMTDNFKNLMKHTWAAVLPYAFLTALCLYLQIPNKMLHDWGEANPLLSFLLQSIAYVCLIVASLCIGATIWKWLTGKAFTHCLKRYTLVSICSFPIIFAGGILLAIAMMAIGSASGISSEKLSSSYIVAALGTLLLIVFIILLLLPFAYI